jgi:nicotinamidase-related amidase
MINRFSSDTTLLVIDAQQGINDLLHWGGPTGRRNNPQAETRIAMLIKGWRLASLPVMFTAHDSRQAVSPLKLSLPGGAFVSGLEPGASELVIRKDVNSAFIGTSLELELRRRGIRRLVVAGFFTNFCVEITVRMAGNMGFDTYLAHDACATTNRIGLDSADHDPQLVHDIAVASMHGEFCTALRTDDLLSLLREDAADLRRAQGNEPAQA